MHDIIIEIINSSRALLIVMGAVGGTLALSWRWVNHVIETRVDEREERQAKERAEMRHRHRMELAEKLETAAAMVVTDKAMAEGIRDKIDAEYPKVRVEQVAEDEEDSKFNREISLVDDEEAEEPKRRRRSKRR